MEWIGCTVCEIFAFKLYCDLETGIQGHTRSSKVTLFDRAHTTLYSYSIVTMPLSSTLSEIKQHIGRKLLVFATPLYLAPPLGVKPSDLRNDPWWRKTRMIGLSDGERISMIRSAVLIQYTRVTDRRNWRGKRAIAYMLSRVKIVQFWGPPCRSICRFINCVAHLRLTMHRPVC